MGSEGKIRIYLDTCSFNRPFDDQMQLNIKFEAEAKIHIQEWIKEGKLDLIWSYILEYENSVNPFPIRKIAIEKWKNAARVHIYETNTILSVASEICKLGIKSKDSLHLACAIEGIRSKAMITDSEIKRKGIELLIKGLGEVEAERFITLIIREPFDYRNL